jgi:ribonuclease P protein subunit POP4
LVKLTKCDYHGSIFTVRKSKNVSLVGIAGIVVKETVNTFELLTEKNLIKGK